VNTKSIAVPVAGRGNGKARRAGHPASLGDEHRVGGLVGEPRKTVAAAAEPATSAYRVGQRLRLRGGGNSLMRVASICEVIAVMPHETGPFLYRVRSDMEQFERIVSEADLALAE
jgi:hypothetical protein